MKVRTGRSRIRTGDKRICNPPHDIDNALPVNGLQNSAATALKGRTKLAPEMPPATLQTDPDLVAVANAWPTLPPALKAGILAMVKAANPCGFLNSKVGVQRIQT